MATLGHTMKTRPWKRASEQSDLLGVKFPTRKVLPWGPSFSGSQMSADAGQRRTNETVVMQIVTEQWKTSVFNYKLMSSRFAYHPAQSWEPPVQHSCPALEICHVTETEEWYVSSMDFWREEPEAFWLILPQSVGTALLHKTPTEAYTENYCIPGL